MKKLLNKFPKLVTFSHIHKISVEQKTFNLPSQQSSVVNYVEYKNHIIAREKVRKTFNLIPFSHSYFFQTTIPSSYRRRCINYIKFNDDDNSTLAKFPKVFV